MSVKEQIAGLRRVSEVLKSGIFNQRKVEVYIGRMCMESTGRLVLSCQETTGSFEVKETVVPMVEEVIVEVVPAEPVIKHLTELYVGIINESFVQVMATVWCFYVKVFLQVRKGYCRGRVTGDYIILSSLGRPPEGEVVGILVSHCIVFF